MTDNADDILNMISALQRMELGDLGRLVRIRNRILDGDIRQEDVNYIRQELSRVHDLKRRGVPSDGKKSSRVWYLLPITLSIVGGIIAYFGLRHTDIQRARKTLLFGFVTFVLFVAILAIGEVVPEPEASNTEFDTMHDGPKIVHDGPKIVHDGLDAEQVPAGMIQDTVTEENESNHASKAVGELQEHRTYTVSYQDVPDYADPDLVISALEQALQAWEYSNEFLSFEMTESDADLEVEWRRWMPHGGLGLYTVLDAGSNRTGNHIITIRLGNDDCHSDYLPYSTESLSHTMGHEIGHYLGLRHIDEEEHLMHSGELFDVDTASTYDDQGYTVPDIADPKIRTQQGQDMLLQIESAKKDLQEIILEREKLRAGSQDPELLLSNTARYNEIAGLVNSLEEDLGCAELAGSLTRFK